MGVARDFNQTTDQALLNAAGLGFPAAQSLFCWFACDTVATPQTLVRYGELGVSPFVGIGMSLNSGKLYGYMNTAAAAPSNVPGTTNHTTDGSWHAAGFSAANSDLRLYLDGAQEANITTQGALAAPGNTDFMAGYSKNFGERYGGGLAYVAYWGIALTGGEQASLAAGAVPSTIQAGSLLAYWPDITQPDTVGAKSFTVTGTTVFATDPPVNGGTPVGRMRSRPMIS